MSLGGVVVNFAAKTRDAIKDLSRLSDELETVDDSTKDIDTSFDTVVDSAEDMARKLRRAAQNMADGVHQGAREVDRETDKVKRSFKEAGRESGAEFVSNVAEGIGSGTGSIRDAVQGTLGGLTNLAASLGGPVGIAAGLAAAGIGTLFAKATAEADKAKERIDRLRSALDGITDKAGEAAQKAIFADWVERTQETAGKLEKINNVLTVAGVSAEDFQKALAGDPTAIVKVTEQIQTQYDLISKSPERIGMASEAEKDFLRNAELVTGELTDSDKAIGAIRREQAAIVKLTGENEKAAEDWAEKQRRVYNETHKIKQEMDRIPSTKNINVITTFIDKNGRPVKLGPGQEAALGVNAQATLPPVVVNVQTSGITPPESARQLVNILETHQVRMGRPRGKARALAW